MSASVNPSRGEIVICQAPDGSVELNLRLEKDTLWLSQKYMALIFDKKTDTIRATFTRKVNKRNRQQPRIPL